MDGKINGIIEQLLQASCLKREGELLLAWDVGTWKTQPSCLNKM